MTLGDRMVKYEDVHRIKLTDRCPKVIRLDGKAFSTYTNKLKRHSPVIHDSMCAAASALLTEIGGTAKFAYIQSDECSVVLNDSNGINTQGWFDNNLQKLTSVTSSIFTYHFNHNVAAYNEPLLEGVPAYFDSRVVLLPSTLELVNYLIWRQTDGMRNSIQQCARERFSHNELQNLKCDDLVIKMLGAGFDWRNDLGVSYRIGTVVDKHNNKTNPVFKLERDAIMEKFFDHVGEEVIQVNKIESTEGT